MGVLFKRVCYSRTYRTSYFLSSGYLGRLWTIHITTLPFLCSHVKLPLRKIQKEREGVREGGTEGQGRGKKGERKRGRERRRREKKKGQNTGTKQRNTFLMSLSFRSLNLGVVKVRVPNKVTRLE